MDPAIVFLIGLTLAVAVLIRAGSRPRRRRHWPPDNSSHTGSGGNVVPIRPETVPPPAPLPVLHGPAYVIDGDTVVIQSTHIRLCGIDAPELDHPYGVRAKRMLITLCKGQHVRAEVREIDHHGRVVAQCFLDDGRDLSAEMVKAGLALDWPKFSGGRYAALEVVGVRKRLWLADARQKGRMQVWEKFAAKRQQSGD